MTGQTISRYRILEKLGEGGMGVVYKAEDTKLRRTVALKFLPPHAIENRERFLREAQAAASLNHPNICTIYEIDDEHGFIAMECIEGSSLKEKIEARPLPLKEALDIAIQLCTGLQAAHEKGIVHRDLKPANLMLTQQGQLKIMDFGLAQVSDRTRLTKTGSSLGTPAYLSPEQARGEAVDRRSDLWSVGVVLYEMISGQLPFRGTTEAAMARAILDDAPEPLTAQRVGIPMELERIVGKALAKSAAERYQHVEDLLVDLKSLPNRTSGTPAAIIRKQPRQWRWAAAGALAASLLGMMIYAIAAWRAPRDLASRSLLRLSVDLGDDASVAARRGAAMALSPDGSRLVFVIGQQVVKSRLAIRRLDQANAMPLAGTDGAEAPFFSPDGKSIAFFADGKLKKMDASGGEPITLCDAASPREGSWGDDGNIIFAATNAGGLSSVPAIGGTPQAVTQLQRGEDTHRYPQVLPGSQAFLFVNGLNADGEGTIEVQSFKTAKRKTLVQPGAYARYLPSGHLIYMRRGTLMASAMDVRRLELTGSPVPVLEDVSFYPSTGTAGFVFSQSGMFVYVAASPQVQMRPIGVLDEKGKLELLPVPKARYGRPRISPDGTRLAVAVTVGPATNLWIYEWGSQRFARTAFMNGNSKYPVWTFDSKYLVFFSDAQSPGPGIYWMRADGAGTAQRLLEGKGLVPSSLSPTTGRLVYAVQGGANAGLWMLPLQWSDAAGPKPGVPERFSDSSADSPAIFSPDGRWLAYISGQSGTPEVFVRPYPGPGGPWQVSTGGGTMVWSRTSRELFYEGKPEPRITVAGYSVAGNSFSPTRPRVWNDTRVASFDLMPDGKHVVMIPAAEQREVTHATFVLNFMDDLQRHLPAGK